MVEGDHSRDETAKIEHDLDLAKIAKSFDDSLERNPSDFCRNRFFEGGGDLLHPGRFCRRRESGGILGPLAEQLLGLGLGGNQQRVAADEVGRSERLQCQAEAAVQRGSVERSGEPYHLRVQLILSQDFRVERDDDAVLDLIVVNHLADRFAAPLQLARHLQGEKNQASPLLATQYLPDLGGKFVSIRRASRFRSRSQTIALSAGESSWNFFTPPDR